VGQYEKVTASIRSTVFFFQIYGDDIYKYKPFKAKLIYGKIWKVYGTVPTEKGGSPFVLIQKSDCKIINVYHEK
jgi:hypothetical protein